MISVIVPCYNGEKWIGRCLRSLLEQTYTDLEILVINDGSTDNTVQAVQTISDPRIRLIDQTNAGVSAARNRGIDEARGELITFVDGDDYVESTYLQTLLSMYRQGCLPVVGFGKNGSLQSVLYDQIGGRYEIGATMPEDYLRGKLGQTIGFSGCNKLFSKQILTAQNIHFDTRLKLGEDMVFVFRYLCHCQSVAVSEKVQYHYCDNDTSAIRSAKDKSAEYEATVVALCEMEENGYTIGEGALCSWCLEVMTYILLNPYAGQMKFPDFRDYLKKMKHFRLVQMATRTKADGNRRRKLLRWALKRKSSMWSFVMVKLQYRRRRGDKR